MSSSDSNATPPLRFVTAASLFDGHDAAINIMRRLIQDKGVEVIHLGHNRSVQEVIDTAIDEDADAICISSYQGGHLEYFKYLIDGLRNKDANHIAVFGGGGGTITPEEINELHQFGVERIYHPNDGMQMGLLGMINDVVDRAQARRLKNIRNTKTNQNHAKTPLQVAELISALENNEFNQDTLNDFRADWKANKKAAVIGITGTGGAGKSSLTDELLNRFNQYLPNLNIAVLAVDPTRRRTGGALLGDRIRMNALRHGNIFMRSMATRRQHLSTTEILQDVIDFLSAQYFDFVIVETAGIGQSDSEIVDYVDHAMYVMTSEFGAASQLEKIDMLDFADSIVINKFEKAASEDAIRDVRKQYRRNRNEFTTADDELPVFATIASQFNDPGVNWLFQSLLNRICKQFPQLADGAKLSTNFGPENPKGLALIPGSRTRYLAEIAENGRKQSQFAIQQKEYASRAQHLYETLKALKDPLLPTPLEYYESNVLSQAYEWQALRQYYQEALHAIDADLRTQLIAWPKNKQDVKDETYEYQVRDKTIKGENYRESLSHLSICKVAPLNSSDWGEWALYLTQENLPGYYPFTAGVFPYRRQGEDPIRMFAGEGTPERTNRRFHYLSLGQPAARLSTAFDSVTLYGENPASRPDIYGKVGNSGVSIASLDDMKKLYSGFDLCDPSTSVSMTINGPAPIILAFFINAAIDQQVEKYVKENGQWHQLETALKEKYKDQTAPQYEGVLPEGNNGLGLGLLGITGDQVLDKDTYEKIKAATLKQIRGTVQADILKEDQAQNTCIFSTEFAMHMMGDIQSYFIDHQVKNFYSVSISGYHIAEAGANPITQLAFTLANGFTIVEYYLSRGMHIDDFAANLSFFFSNGMDPEYAVIGRVARRIWARALKNLYNANERSQKLKYHIQTSGRSLHAQEIQFNDIRTTLQAMYALFDNCNSLHTNAYDEALTTPTEESVRRAVAIQMIINKELGLNQCENPLQGSYFIESLTDLVEEAVYEEFERLNDRGGVLGAMDTMYQRSKIQDESMFYEHKKHDGSLEIVGVNTFISDHSDGVTADLTLARSSEEEKNQQIKNIQAFELRHRDEIETALNQLKNTAKIRGNTFAMLMEAVKCASLGQISHALYEAGGEYRRNM
ncbi:methylmalonyl-CoA mutase family protein [Bermanella marisrubri]|uniref:Fused isobutyryl-CoA mutase n=1 Tax=Bermanella marisrubri TaxID=207949 RepID=Q1N637_9GAMM|nr:methylmalonyl-CoA mutase family protein [Bermanella marisrubri]EAT13755.1 methylmalonyl-CoA mutase [Oceanobacter sp. RED65] [Bermanella marisrubri]QIZ84529.1 methylmalonyl-CoA mutase family protein [Bermanella marisrubri]